MEKNDHAAKPEAVCAAFREIFGMSFLLFVPAVVLFFLWPLMLSNPTAVFLCQFVSVSFYAVWAGSVLKRIPEPRHYVTRVSVVLGGMVIFVLMSLLIFGIPALAVLLMKVSMETALFFAVFIPAAALYVFFLFAFWPVFALPVVWPWKTGRVPFETEEDWYGYSIWPGLKLSFKAAFYGGNGRRYGILSVSAMAGLLVCLYYGSTPLDSPAGFLRQAFIGLVCLPAIHVIVVENTWRVFHKTYPRVFAGAAGSRSGLPGNFPMDFKRKKSARKTNTAKTEKIKTGRCAEQKREVIRRLQQDSTAFRGKEGSQVLYELIVSGCCGLIDLLAENGCDVNGTFAGKSMLCHAVEHSQGECVDRLLALGADPGAAVREGVVKMSLAGADENISLKLIKASPPGDDSQKEELFFEAVNRGRLKIIQCFLETGYDPGRKNIYGEPPLLYAAMQDNPEVPTILINAGADVNQRSDNGTTALMRAVEFGKNGVARRLLDNGADPDVKDKDGRTALSMLASSLARDDAELAERLLRHKKGMAADALGKTPLMAAAEGGKTSVLADLLDRSPALNQTDSRGWTALHYACKNLKDECIRMLLGKGAGVNRVDKSGRTPIGLLLEGRRHEKLEKCALILLNSGADLSIPDGKGRFPSESAAALGMPALIRKFADPMKNSGKEEGIDWNAHFEAARLAKAVFDGDSILEEKWLRSKILPPQTFVRIAGGKLVDIMFAAVKKGRVKAAAYFLDGGADVNMTDGDSNTPLHIAVRHSDFEMAGFLIERGADIERATERGYTPIQFSHSKEMVEFLRKRGAVKKPPVSGE